MRILTCFLAGFFASSFVLASPCEDSFNAEQSANPPAEVSPPLAKVIPLEQARKFNLQCEQCGESLWSNLHQIIPQEGRIKTDKPLFNLQDLNGNTPLQLAIRYRNPEAVEQIINAKMDLNAKDENGDTSLHLAVFYFPEIIPALLQGGADPNITNQKGDVPLITLLRAKGQDLATIKALAERTQLSLQSASPRSPIIHIVFENYFSFLEKKTKKSPSKKSTSKKSAENPETNPLPPDVMSEQASNPKTNLGSEVKTSAQVLENIIDPKKYEIVEYFANQSIKWKNDEFGQNIFHILAKIEPPHLESAYKKSEWEHLMSDVFNTLAKAQAKRKTQLINAKDENGDTPLHGSSNTATSIILLRAGAEINVQNNLGDTPIHKIISRSHPDKERPEDINHIEYLISRGASLSIKNEIGDTPIHHAILLGNPVMVQTILKHATGVHSKEEILDATDRNGRNPLKKAAHMATVYHGKAENINLVAQIDDLLKNLNLAKGEGIPNRQFIYHLLKKANEQ